MIFDDPNNPPEISVTKDSEFFIAIAKQEGHSFVMLGVSNNNSIDLLARVGKVYKTNGNKINASMRCRFSSLFIFSHAPARLTQEWLYRKENILFEINYQAYAITYEQVCSFLTLVKNIKEDHNKIEGYCSNNIRAYCPIEEKNDRVTFNFQGVSLENKIKNVKEVPNATEISEQSSKLCLTNSCRTTARSILEAVLGFNANISNNFLNSFRFKGALLHGQPIKDQFYILPNPPEVFAKEMPEHQLRTLKILYQRLEEIPQKNPNSPETTAKFNAVKALYNSLAPNNNISAGKLLTEICKYEQRHAKQLNAQRSPLFFSRLFDCKSSTEIAFQNIRNQLSSSNSL